MRPADFNENADKIDAVLTAVQTLATTNQVVVASYTGDNLGGHTRSLGFTHKFVLLLSKFSSKPYMAIATADIRLYFDRDGTEFNNTRCVEGGVYIYANTNYSKDTNYYLAVR